MNFNFEDVCFRCGSPELFLEAMEEKKRDFAIVRPICQTCFLDGKPVVTRNAVKIKKAKTV